jgi:hypothetical protein
MPFRLLLSGMDTVECAYYLSTAGAHGLDFEQLAQEKELLRQSKSRNPRAIVLGDKEFLLAPYGSSSGYPFLIEHADAVIAFGEFNNPSFYVKYKSLALWNSGALRLHENFLAWATSVGLVPFKPESLSRVDFSFDYQINPVDFTEDHFLSQSKKDSRFRKDGRTQTIQFGRDDVILRVYDKVAEIEEASQKTWFYDLWGVSQNVWRMEWQVRKPVLKRFGLRTFDDLQSGQGDLLRYLAHEHDTLRRPSADRNRSRWPLHPLWHDLQTHIETFNSLGVYRDLDEAALLEERATRIAVAVYGYLKRLAAIDSVRRNRPVGTTGDTLNLLAGKVGEIHDPFSWDLDVKRRVEQIRMGRW